MKDSKLLKLLPSKNYFVFFLLIYLFLGFFLSLKIGISHDEMHEQQNWIYNTKLVENFLNEKKIDSNYTDKYYGIGFQIISQPLQYLISKISTNFLDVDASGLKLVSKHPVVFIFFFISGIFFFKILVKITENNNFSYLGTFLYLLYPYLFGHGLFNPKDIPFLSIWLICTFLSCNILDFYIKKNKISFFSLFVLSTLTAFLLSVRISGILIFIQYFISFFICFNNTKFNFNLSKAILPKILFFIGNTFFFTIVFYPVFWTNPFEIINAIKFMGKFYHDVCTLTLGKCVPAQNIDALYMPIWFFFKLPIIILLGIFLIPFVEKKIFINNTNNLFFGTILTSSILIPLLLIINKTPLYDEVRHVLFLVPMFFLLGLTTLYYFSKKISILLTIFFLFFFTFENIKIFPYQYNWFNLSARFLDISKNFELEYMGISGKELAQKVKEKNKENYKQICVVVSPVYSVKPFLNEKYFDCFYNWTAIDGNTIRPFWAIQTVRNLKKSIPYKCNVIEKETINLTFYKKTLVAGNLLECK